MTIWGRATAYLEKDRKAHLKAHGDWHLDSGKLETALEPLPTAFNTMLHALRAAQTALNTAPSFRIAHPTYHTSYEVAAAVDRAIALAAKVSA